MYGIVPVFMEQLESAERRLGEVEEVIHRSSYSEDAQRLLTRMTGEIRTRILECRFAVVRAGAELDGDRLQAAADRIPAIFADTEHLHYLASTSDFDTR